MLDKSDEARIRALAEGYCKALHESDAAFFEDLCHDRFFMTSVQPDGKEWFIDKSQFVQRRRDGQPLEGEPSFEILAVDVEPEMAHVKLWVDMEPRRFCDYLGFMKTADGWKMVTKLYRTARGPAQ